MLTDMLCLREVEDRARDYREEKKRLLSWLTTKLSRKVPEGTVAMVFVRWLWTGRDFGEEEFFCCDQEECRAVRRDSRHNTNLIVSFKCLYYRIHDCTTPAHSAFRRSNFVSLSCAGLSGHTL